MKYSFVIILVIITSACSQSIKENQLFGKWKVVEYKAYADSEKIELVRIARKLSLGTIHTLYTDKTINTKEINDANERKAPWDFNESSSMLTISYSNTHKMLYEISEFQDSTMKWTRIENNKNYYTLTLEKIKK